MSASGSTISDAVCGLPRSSAFGTLLTSVQRASGDQPTFPSLTSCAARDLPLTSRQPYAVSKSQIPLRLFSVLVKRRNIIHEASQNQDGLGKAKFKPTEPFPHIGCAEGLPPRQVAGRVPVNNVLLRHVECSTLDLPGMIGESRKFKNPIQFIRRADDHALVSQLHKSGIGIVAHKTCLIVRR